MSKLFIEIDNPEDDFTIEFCGGCKHHIIAYRNERKENPRNCLNCGSWLDSIEGEAEFKQYLLRQAQIYVEETCLFNKKKKTEKVYKEYLQKYNEKAHKLYENAKQKEEEKRLQAQKQLEIEENKRRLFASVGLNETSTVPTINTEYCLDKQYIDTDVMQPFVMKTTERYYNKGTFYVWKDSEGFKMASSEIGSQGESTIGNLQYVCIPLEKIWFYKFVGWDEPWLDEEETRKEGHAVFKRNDTRQCVLWIKDNEQDKRIWMLKEAYEVLQTIIPEKDFSYIQNEMEKAIEKVQIAFEMDKISEFDCESQKYNIYVEYLRQTRNYKALKELDDLNLKYKPFIESDSDKLKFYKTAIEKIQDIFRTEQKEIDDNIKRIQEMEQRKDKILQDQHEEALRRLEEMSNRIKSHVEDLSHIGQIKCPNCGGYNVNRIGLIDKAASYALVGPLSLNRQMKTYHCNDCKYEW